MLDSFWLNISMQSHTNKKYQLSQSTIEKIGYYVYLLIDPRDNEVFYVGKGCGNRIYQHVLGAIKNTSKKSAKIQHILDIRDSGKAVQHKILRHGLTESESLEVEGSIIGFIGKKELTNKVLGHNSENRGLMTLQEIKVNYEAEEAVIVDPVMIININKLYYKEITPSELYEKTRCSWVLGERRNKADFVICTYRGIVREVYSITEWVKAERVKRWEFIGDIAPKKVREKYLHKSIKNYQKQGAQNPIKYVNA
jgi:hypothetical protein